MSEYDDLLPDEPAWDKKKGPKPLMEVEEELQNLPVEAEPDEEPPPEPPFIKIPNAYGPGAHSFKFADGTPIGVFVRERNMTPDEVDTFLTELGMEAKDIDFFVRNRRKGIEADKQIAGHPAVAAFAEEEAHRAGQKKEVQAAFLEAYKKSQSKEKK